MLRSVLLVRTLLAASAAWVVGEACALRGAPAALRDEVWLSPKTCVYACSENLPRGPALADACNCTLFEEELEEFLELVEDLLFHHYGQEGAAALSYEAPGDQPSQPPSTEATTAEPQPEFGADQLGALRRLEDFFLERVEYVDDDETTALYESLAWIAAKSAERWLSVLAAEEEYAPENLFGPWGDNPVEFDDVVDVIYDRLMRVQDVGERRRMINSFLAVAHGYTEDDDVFGAYNDDGVEYFDARKPPAPRLAGGSSAAEE